MHKLLISTHVHTRNSGVQTVLRTHYAKQDVIVISTESSRVRVSPVCHGAREFLIRASAARLQFCRHPRL